MEQELERDRLKILRQLKVPLDVEKQTPYVHLMVNHRPPLRRPTEIVFTLRSDKTIAWPKGDSFEEILGKLGKMVDESIAREDRVRAINEDIQRQKTALGI